MELTLMLTPLGLGLILISRPVVVAREAVSGFVESIVSGASRQDTARKT